MAPRARGLDARAKEGLCYHRCDSPLSYLHIRIILSDCKISASKREVLFAVSMMAGYGKTAAKKKAAEPPPDLHCLLNN